jgi:ABC-type Fe3+-hydroxamate transport system substrate-binding protein
MTPNGDTYASDLLSLCGAENVFTGRTDSRYPAVTPDDVIAADPEIVLLPNEPFAFQEEDASYFIRTMTALPAVRQQNIRRVDGRLLFWHGTRLGEAIRQLPQWFRLPAEI